MHQLSGSGIVAADDILRSAPEATLDVFGVGGISVMYPFRARRKAGVFESLLIASDSGPHGGSTEGLLKKIDSAGAAFKQMPGG